MFVVIKSDAIRARRVSAASTTSWAKNNDSLSEGGQTKLLSSFKCAQQVDLVRDCHAADVGLLQNLCYTIIYKIMNEEFSIHEAVNIPYL